MAEPMLAWGDGTPGYRAAQEEAWPGIGNPCGWVYKSAYVLNEPQ